MQPFNYIVGAYFSDRLFSDLQKDVRAETERAPEAVRQAGEEAQGSKGGGKVHQASRKSRSLTPNDPPAYWAPLLAHGPGPHLCVLATTDPSHITLLSL